MTAKKKMSLAVAAALQAGGLVSIASATSIYTETWSGGTIPSAYTVAHSTAADGASIVGANNVLTTTSGTTGVTTGNVQISTNTTGAGSLYDPSFNSQIDSNGDSNLLTWTLNMQESRSNPSGFASSNSGVAYILSASDPNFLSTGEGYALTIGSTSTDPVCLIHYTAGLAAVGLNAVNSPFNMLKTTFNASQHYTSVRLTYAPGTDTWKMYARDDGTTGFTDAIGTPVPDTSIVGSIVQAASAAAAGYSGFVQTHFTTANDLGQFDNISLNIDPIAAQPARNLLWDADATGAATDGSGSWSTANTWIDQADGVTHATWDGTRPDNAIIGAGSGAVGSATIDMGASGQTVGMITFAGSSPSYTLANGTILLNGYDDDANPATQLNGMVLNQSATINSTLNWAGNAAMHVNGSGTTLTMNGALAGGGNIDKLGAGTLVLTTTAPSRSGVITIDTGTVQVPTSSVVSGITGWGTGTINIKSGATLWLDASAGDYTVGGTSGTMTIGDQSTLRVTGNVTWQKNYPQFIRGTDPTAGKNSTIHVDAGGTLTFRAQIRNDGTTPQSFHTIHMDGPGTIKLTNSGSDGGGDSDIFGGDWDLSNGTLILGQNTETGGSSGDTLNALGFKNGDTKLGNTITIRGTGTMVATENDDNANPNDTPVISYYRAKVIMAGGTMASGNGKDTSWVGNFTTSTGTTSTLATYDPLNPATPRSTSLIHGPADFTASQGDTIWQGNLIIDPGTTTGGAFNITRDAITGSADAYPTGISVSPGASITVKNGAILNVNGSADALSDGTNNVNIINNSSTGGSGLNLSNGTKNVGTIDGTGTMTVGSDGVLVASHIVQNTATLNGNTTIRPNSTAAGVSNIRNLVINTGVRLDIQDNKVVTANLAGTWNGSAYTDTTGLVAGGKGVSNNWDGTTGIVTSQPAAVGSNFTSIGVAKASDVLPSTATATGTWAGQTITGTDTLVMYTYGGDATLDGKINVDDYIRIDSGIAAGLTGWSNGDFNYDGKVNIDDYTGFIDANIGTQGPQFFTAGGAAGGGASGVTAVPEPASLALLSLGATAILGSRRRRKA